MRYALHFCFLVAVGFYVLGSAMPRESGVALAAVKINEVLPAPASDWDGDLQADSKKDEWVEIMNAGEGPAALSGLYLLNGESKALVYGFTGTLASGGYKVVSGTDAVAWESLAGESSIGLSLNNTGDKVWLVRISGTDTTVLDTMSFETSDVGYDVSIGRAPDGTGAWTLRDHFSPMGGSGADPTPGASNTSNAPPHVLALTREPISPTEDDSVRITIQAGDASGITSVRLFYQINLENGEEPEMTRVSGDATLGEWVYTILPCAAGDTLRYRGFVFDSQETTTTAWSGYRVRTGGIGMRINEVLADPASDITGDANRDGIRDSADDEFIELVNCNSVPIDLAGWKLSDLTSVRHTFPDSGMVVQPGEYVTVFGGGDPTGFTGKVLVASTGGISLTNTGDAVSLLDRSGNLVDIYSFGSEGGKDESLMRVPDCTGDWKLASEAGLTVPFTPQQPNGGGSAVTPTTWGGIKSLFK